MDRLLSLFCLLLLAVGTSHATLPAQVYWNTVLPKSPMPSAIRDLLHPDTLADPKSGTVVNVGKGGVHVGTQKGATVNVGHKAVGVNTGGNTHVGVGKGGVHVSTGKGKPGGTNVNVGHGGVGVNVKGGHGNTNVGVGKGGVGVSTGHKGKPVVVAGPYYSPFVYKYAASETQTHVDPSVTLFFLEKDLHAGAKMNLQFTKTASSSATFLPRKAADAIPFSRNKLPEVLNMLSVAPNSVEADAMKKTLEECESPAAEGEKKYCATSLESMVDFSTSSLGTRDIRAVSTEIKKQSAAGKEEYTVAPSGLKRLPGSKLVACHAESYAYAVFYCHSTGTTRAYTVALEGNDGASVEAVAVCHTDTSAWNPKHVAFQMLKVKPGTMPICHFLPQDHVVWTPRV